MLFFSQVADVQIVDEAARHHEDENGCTYLFFLFPQMDLVRQGGGNTQTSDAVSHLMPEKKSVTIGGRDPAAAA